VLSVNAISPSKIFDTLHSASALLQAGQHRQAQELLGELLRSHAGLAEAHWLLARSLFETDDTPGAQRELKACIRLDPNKAHPYALLGHILSSTGQMEEAVRILRQAVRLDGEYLPGVSTLARALLMQGRADEARALIEPLAHKGKATPDLLMLLGHALMSLGLAADAAGAFRQALRASPTNNEARFRLAAALADSGQYVEAETILRANPGEGMSAPEARFVLARAMMGQNKMDAAEAELRKVVQTRPDHVTAQNNLSELVWMRSGDVQAASAELDNALRANPRFSPLRIGKAKLLLTAQQPAQALAEIEAGLALADSDSALLNAAAQIAIDFDAPRALDYAQRALQLAPSSLSALIAMGNASLAVGHAEQSLAIAEKLSRRDPRDGQAIALQANAWRMLGDSRYQALFDYSHLVRAQLIDTPEGWIDLPGYLADLAQCLARQHTLHAHPIGQSLRHGSQLELEPESSSDAAIRAFPQAIDGPIRRYMEAIGQGDDPLRLRNTGKYTLRGAWSVRLRPNGFHVNHYHPQGWLSSACYIQLPKAIDKRNGEGWLQFGEPAFPTVPPMGAEYFLKPELGLLALFPSYMWHGTVPFSGTADDTRLTIAFDVIPG